MRSPIHCARNSLIAVSILMFLGALAACTDDESNGDAGAQFQAGNTGTSGTGGASAVGATSGVGGASTTEGITATSTGGQGGTSPAATGGQPALDSGMGDGQVAQDSATNANQTMQQDSATTDGQTAQDSAPVTPVDGQTSGADAAATDSAGNSGSTNSVTIQFLTQSSFVISAQGGIAVVTDPWNVAPTVEPQVVTVSHGDLDHNNVDIVPCVASETCELLRSEEGVGQHEVAGITFTGVATFHDDVSGASRGNNTVFVWDMEGIHFAHLGDLGHLLTDEQIQQIGAVDVLMIPTGGGFTIDAPTAVQVAQQLSAKLVIPMHNQLFGGPEPFLAAVPADWTVEQPGTASITVTAADFVADSTKVVVLKP